MGLSQIVENEFQEQKSEGKNSVGHMNQEVEMQKEVLPESLVGK